MDQKEFAEARGYSVWFLVGNGGMDPYSSPYTIPNNCPHNPFPHFLLSTREFWIIKGQKWAKFFKSLRLPLDTEAYTVLSAPTKDTFRGVFE